MKIDRSRALYSRARKLMPGGVSSPVRSFKSVEGEPIYIKKGSGSRMIDEDNNEYIDYCMSWGPLILGHADPHVINAIRRAAKNGTSFGTANALEITLARLIYRRFPSIDMLRFVNSGTEATMSAIRLARGVTGRDKIIKFDGCYHGHADHLLVAGGSGLATFGIPDSAGVTANNARDTLVSPFNDIESLKEIFDRESGSIAAIIMEPVPCNYGLILPDRSFLAATRELCDRNGSLLIFDEVITGLRLAPGGAQEYFGIHPDITTLGKIIGGGLPVGAYGAKRSIMEQVSPLGRVYQAGTLSGNPLAMTAGIHTIKKVDKIAACEILHEKGTLMDDLLRPSLERYKGRVLFQRLESIFSVYFTGAESVQSLGQVKECDMKAFSRFHAEMLKRKIYFSPSGYEVGFLSTAHGDDDIELTATAFNESLDAVFSR